MLIKFELTIEVEGDFPKYLTPGILSQLEDELNKIKELSKYNWSVYDQEYSFDEEEE